MDVFVAKQPIFDEKENVIAYELLYRSNLKNEYTGSDGDKATSEVLVNSFLNIGIKELSKGKPCFINFTENLLKLKLPTYFTPLQMVVEILENVKITPEIISICKELKLLGYTIALDDFFLMHGDELTIELLELVDIVKIDFRFTNREARRQLMDFLKPYNLKFLGEKIETREEYDQAKEDHYHYFQGYFFSKPVILQSHDIPAYFHSYLMILEDLDSPDPDIEHITKVIEGDLSLSYKLLKLINSPVIRPKYEISSIKQAVVLLGLIEIKKWIYVIALRGLHSESSDHKVNELIFLSLSRGKLGELIAKKQNQEQYSSKYFLLGMLSLIDSLLNLPMEEILNELPILSDVKIALLGKENEYKKVLDTIKKVEKEANSNSKPLAEDEWFSLYSEANIWASAFIDQMEKMEY